MSSDCPFCDPSAEKVLFEGEFVIGLRDEFPVSPGHSLIVPKRHLADWFEATPEEQAGLWSAVESVRHVIEQQHQPDGYNVGFNCGRAAGQTVFHLHLHVIPRYEGDVKDPRGGIRNVIPDKARYWEEE